MPPKPAGQGRGGSSQASNSKASQALLQAQRQDGQSQAGSSTAAPKKKKHRAGRKRRPRRQSFAATDENSDMTDRPNLDDIRAETAAARSSFYRIEGGNRSIDSLESEALLDHRDSGPLQARRQSIHQSFYQVRPGHHSPQQRGSQSLLLPTSSRRPGSDDEEEEDTNDRTPLLSSSQHKSRAPSQKGGVYSSSNRQRSVPRSLRSNTSKTSRRRPGLQTHNSTRVEEDYDVNNPPSVPGSPVLGAGMRYDDAMLTGDIARSGSPEVRRTARPGSRDALIDIEEHAIEANTSTPPSPRLLTRDRRHTLSNPAEADVCFPADRMSEIGQEDALTRESEGQRPRRRRTRLWPDLQVLEEWSREEKEERTMEGVRMRKVSEPLLVGGRLRPQKRVWQPEDDDRPYRFTYFNEEFQNTIHSQTISELVQDGQGFRELFRPDPPLLSESDSEDDDDDDAASRIGSVAPSILNGQPGNHSRVPTRQPSHVGMEPQASAEEPAGNSTPVQTTTEPQKKQPRYGERPVFWLDVLSPTEAEMRTISKAFGIHPLTAEDIMVQEAREKVELFRNYYFVNYRTFEQDPNSEDYMEPVNMFIVVFREGIITFHFSMIPHPANVRRRIRQLSDYLILTADWISYAIIDDITDVYAPLIQRIEDEVDGIDDAILNMHMNEAEAEKARKDKKDKRLRDEDHEKHSESGASTLVDNPGSMLLSVGECRKKVMGLYRLLGNKADVIKGFAKRCNEQWDVAPRSDIGLYLGDIQDHIVTMTGNLTHYESLLSRAHSNYLAQINIKMNERQEQTADVLGKLTVLGTIVLPMNIITGMWGMNVLVPGQDVQSLWWFWGITAGLLMFGVSSFLIAKRVYGIV